MWAITELELKSTDYSFPDTSRNRPIESKKLAGLDIWTYAKYHPLPRLGAVNRASGYCAILLMQVQASWLVSWHSKNKVSQPGFVSCLLRPSEILADVRMVYTSTSMRTVKTLSQRIMSTYWSSTRKLLSRLPCSHISIPKAWMIWLCVLSRGAIMEWMFFYPRRGICRYNNNNNYNNNNKSNTLFFCY